MSAGESVDEVAYRVGDRLAELDRHAWGQHDAECVTQSRGVLDRRRHHPTRATGPSHTDGPARGAEFQKPRGVDATRQRILITQRAEDSQQVRGILDVAGSTISGEVL